MSGTQRRFFLSRREMLFAVGALALVALISIASFFLVAARVEAVLIARQAAIVDSEIRYLHLIDVEEGRPALIRAISRRASLANDDLPIHALVDAQGKYLAGDVDWPKNFIADGAWRAIETFRRANGSKVTGFGRAVRLADGVSVLIGRDESGRHSVQSALADAILLALVALVLVSVALIVLLNRVVLGRIDAIVATAHRIIGGNLHERIPLRGQDDEFERLSATLNVMLDRNQTHIDQMRIVSDAIAHDLRLPLQRVKGDLERALKSSDEAERAKAFADAEREMDEALATFNALIEINRAESGIGAESFEALDLAAIATDVAELFEPVAEDKDQSLALDVQPAMVRGQGTLLRQALGNLIQNAIKFSAPGASLKVRVEQTSTTASLIVEDTGPGIPEADHQTALRPFGRLSRDVATEGKGLGLALVAACAKLHGGALRLESANPGLRAVIDLPKEALHK